MKSLALDRVKEYKRDLLIALYNSAETGQREVFLRMYNCGPATLAEDKIDWAIQQCENTLVKNGKSVEEVLNTVRVPKTASEALFEGHEGLK